MHLLRHWLIVIGSDSQFKFILISIFDGNGSDRILASIAIWTIYL